MVNKSGMSRLWREFVSEENRNYKLRLGSTVASSLAGILCGAIVASIVWFVALKYIFDIAGDICIK